jgi:hypothetical protein
MENCPNYVRALNFWILQNLDNLPLTGILSAIKIASPKLDTGVFQFASLQGEIDMET